MKTPLDFMLEEFDQRTKGILRRAGERETIRLALYRELKARHPQPAVIAALTEYLEAA